MRRLRQLVALTLLATVAGAAAFLGLRSYFRTSFAVTNRSERVLSELVVIAGGDGCRVGALVPGASGSCSLLPDREEAALVIFHVPSGERRVLLTQSRVSPGRGETVRLSIEGPDARAVRTE